MKTLSLRTRLTLFYSITLVVVLVVFAADVLITQNRLGLRRADAELDDVHATLAGIIGEELGEHDPPEVAAREAREALGSLGMPIAIFDAHGTPVATGVGPLAIADLTPFATASSVRTVTTREGQWRVASQPASFGATTMQLVIARPLNDIAREQHEVQEAMFVVIPLALLLAGAGGWWLASIGLRPVTEMARRAANIPLTGMEDLGPAPRDDELGQLARAFNGLVARLRLSSTLGS